MPSAKYRLFYEIGDGPPDTVDRRIDTLDDAVEGILSGRGALVYKSADQTNADYTTAALLTFDTVAYDTESITGGNRLTVPADVTRVRLKAHVHLANVVPNNFTGLYVLKNGSPDYVGQAGGITHSSLTVMEVGADSPILTVVPGDYFEAFLLVGYDTVAPSTGITVYAVRTWFAMEIIG